MFDATEAFDYLLDNGICTEDELALISAGWGHNLDTYETALFIRTGNRDFEQATETDEDEDDN